MTAIASPNFWLPPSMRQRPKKRWLDRALDFNRWKRRLLDVFAPIGLAADGDIMLDPDGDLVLDAAGEMELQDSTDCAACCPGCSTCWTNVDVPSINIEIAGYNYPTTTICYFQCNDDPSTDGRYGTSCDPCAVGFFSFDSGSLDASFNVPASSIDACPGFGGGCCVAGGHWRGWLPSPATWLFTGTATGSTQLIPAQCLLFDMTCCCAAGGCAVSLQIFLIGCACDDTGATMFVLFDGSALLSPMTDSFTMDNEIASADQAFGAPLCQDHIIGGWGGTATVTKGT